MGAEEGFDDDVGEFRPPPSPDDRLWRHPAEMAKAVGAPPPSPAPVVLADDRHGRSLRRSPLAVGVASVVSGAVLACSVMFAAGGIGDEPDRLGLAPLATLVPGDGTDVGIVSVEVDAATGARSASALVLRDGTHVVTSAQVVPQETAGDTAGPVTSAISSPTRRDEPAIRIIDEQGVVHRGRVVAVDHANDLAIVRTDGAPLTPYDTSRTTSIAADAEVTIDGGGYGAGLRRWRSTAGEPVAAYHGDNIDLVGVALLADPLPAAATGAVALDADGALAGLVVVDLRRGSTGGATRLPAVVVPAERVLRVAEQFLATGSIDHAWLGVEGTPDLDTTRQVARRGGAVVEHVVPGSPAGLAGLREGDILTRVCDTTVRSIDDVVRRLLELEPDAPCGLDVVRDGSAWQTTVQLGRRAA